MAASTQNHLAQSFKALHKPGSPLVLANVYDGITAKTIAALTTSKAIATASYAVAQAAGLEDDDLTLEVNLAAARAVTSAVKPYEKPVTVDIQDGYGEQLEQAITALLRLGVVGVNLEDCNKDTNTMFAESEAATRVKRVLAVAKENGVPDFIVNARCDALLHGGSLSEVISRGRAYLDAGATTVFVWGGSSRGGITRDEVVQLVEAFDGRLNVSMKLAAEGLTVKQLAEIGVARISIGPALQFAAVAKFKEEAERILQE